MQTRGICSEAVAVERSSEGSVLDVDALGGLNLASVRRLREMVSGADIVIAHGSKSLPASAAACATITPFLYRSVGDPAYWSATGFRRRRSQFLLQRAAHIVTLWPGARSTLIQRGIDEDRITSIPNAVPVERFPVVTDADRKSARAQLGLDPNAPVACFLGALSREKRPDRMLYLARRRPDLTVLIVGDGPLATELAGATRGLRNVRLLAAMSNPFQALAASDVLVIPSETEGIPAVAIEAGLSALPVVATDVGGLREAVEHDRTGVLISEEHDLPDAVDLAIRRRSELGVAARARCALMFDIDVVADQWLTLLRSVLSGTGT